MIGVGQRRRQRAVLTAESTGDAPKRRHRPDHVLAILMLLLLLLGLIVIYSISPGLAEARHVSANYYTGKQLLAVFLGFVTFGIMATVPVSFWRRMGKPLIVVAAAATVLALLIPVSPDYPAHRWIRLGGLSFQSVELIKFAIIFVLSGFLIQRAQNGELNDVNKTLKPLAIIVLVLGVVVAKLQSDLGSTAVMVAMIGSMAYVAGMPIRKVALIGGIILVGGILAISTTAYRRDRLLTFLHPESDCQTAGYQACQALIAVGSGGVAGKGLGQSVQAYGYLPEAANDSIFAIYSEKFGFIGSAILISLFMAFFTRLKGIMERAPDDYTRLVLAGILAWLSTQTLINIGAMIGLLPMKGITLPFISYGGTSIIFTTAAIGLVYNISRYTTYAVPTDKEVRSSTPSNGTGRRRYSSYSGVTRVGR
jgi:cell division protein FtsW